MLGSGPRSEPNWATPYLTTHALQARSSCEYTSDPAWKLLPSALCWQLQSMAATMPLCIASVPSHRAMASPR